MTVDFISVFYFMTVERNQGIDRYYDSYEHCIQPLPPLMTVQAVSLL